MLAEIERLPQVNRAAAVSRRPFARGSVVRLIIAQGLRPVVVGLAGGLLASLLLSRWLETLLFEIARTDAWTYAGVAAILLAASALACTIPARHAARVDVMAALRSE